MAIVVICPTHGRHRVVGRSRRCPACPPRKPRTAIPVDEHPAIVARIRNGETLDAVGRGYGTSRQRIHQIVMAVDPDAVDLGNAIRRAVRVEARRVAAEVRRAVDAMVVGRCRACLGPLTYGRASLRSDRPTVTCSHRCYELWRIADYHLDDDAYQWRRHANAKSVLANPGVPETKRQHAALVLAGKDPGPNRRFTVSGSAMSRAAEELRALRRKHEGRVAP